MRSSVPGELRKPMQRKTDGCPKSTRSRRSSESKGKILIAAVSEESNANSRINLTPKTWIARPLSEPGKGPCPSGGCKHMRLAHNPINGRIYFLGGDYGGPGAMASARNELFSYSIKENNWNLEYPYCGPAGDIQPDHPDEVGCIDTRRKVF